MMPSSRVASSASGRGVRVAHPSSTTILDRSKGGGVFIVNASSNMKFSSGGVESCTLWATNNSTNSAMTGSATSTLLDTSPSPSVNNPRGGGRSSSSSFTDSQERHRLRKHKSRLAAQIRRNREAETLSSLEKILPLQCLPTCLEISEILRLTFVSLKLLGHMRELYGYQPRKAPLLSSEYPRRRGSHFDHDTAVLSPYGSMESLASNSSTLTLKSSSDGAFTAVRNPSYYTHDFMSAMLPSSSSPSHLQAAGFSAAWEASGCTMVWVDRHYNLLYISPHLGRRLKPSWVNLLGEPVHHLWLHQPAGRMSLGSTHDTATSTPGHWFPSTGQIVGFPTYFDSTSMLASSATSSNSGVSTSALAEKESSSPFQHSRASFFSDTSSTHQHQQQFNLQSTSSVSSSCRRSPGSDMMHILWYECWSSHSYSLSPATTSTHASPSSSNNSSILSSHHQQQHPQQHRSTCVNMTKVSNSPTTTTHTLQPSVIEDGHFVVLVPCPPDLQRSLNAQMKNVPKSSSTLPLNAATNNNTNTSTTSSSMSRSPNMTTPTPTTSNSNVVRAHRPTPSSSLCTSSMKVSTHIRGSGGGGSTTTTNVCKEETNTCNSTMGILTSCTCGHVVHLVVDRYARIVSTQYIGSSSSATASSGWTGKKLYELMHLDDVARFAQEWNDMMTGGVSTTSSAVVPIPSTMFEMSLLRLCDLRAISSQDMWRLHTPRLYRLASLQAHVDPQFSARLSSSSSCSSSPTLWPNVEVHVRIMYLESDAVKDELQETSGVQVKMENTSSATPTAATRMLEELTEGSSFLSPCSWEDPLSLLPPVKVMEDDLDSVLPSLMMDASGVCGWDVAEDDVSSHKPTVKVDADDEDAVNRHHEHNATSSLGVDWNDISAEVSACLDAAPGDDCWDKELSELDLLVFDDDGLPLLDTSDSFLSSMDNISAGNMSSASSVSLVPFHPPPPLDFRQEQQQQQGAFSMQQQMPLASSSAHSQRRRRDNSPPLKGLMGGVKRRRGESTNGGFGWSQQSSRRRACLEVGLPLPALKSHHSQNNYQHVKQEEYCDSMANVGGRDKWGDKSLRDQVPNLYNALLDPAATSSDDFLLNDSGSGMHLHQVTMHGYGKRSVSSEVSTPSSCQHFSEGSSSPLSSLLSSGGTPQPVHHSDSWKMGVFAPPPSSQMSVHLSPPNTATHFPDAGSDCFFDESFVLNSESASPPSMLLLPDPPATPSLQRRVSLVLPSSTTRAVVPLTPEVVVASSSLMSPENSGRVMRTTWSRAGGGTILILQSSRTPAIASRGTSSGSTPVVLPAVRLAARSSVS